MMLMRTLRENRVALKQFAAAVRGHNAQALPLMTSAPLDFPCVLFSHYCKSDRAALAELPNILLQQPPRTNKNMRACRGTSFAVDMFEWRGWVGGNQVKGFQFSPISLWQAYNGSAWRFPRRPDSFRILLFFISPEVAKSTWKFTPTFVNPPTLHWNEPGNTESHPKSHCQYSILHHHTHGRSVTLISTLNSSPQKCGQPSSAWRPDPGLESGSACDLNYRSLTVHPTFMHAHS